MHRPTWRGSAATARSPGLLSSGALRLEPDYRLAQLLVRLVEIGLRLPPVAGAVDRPSTLGEVERPYSRARSSAPAPWARSSPGAPHREEGCRPANRGLALGLMTGIHATRAARRRGRRSE